jgi:hypothetical protein
MRSREAASIGGLFLSSERGRDVSHAVLPALARAKTVRIEGPATIVLRELSALPP